MGFKFNENNLKQIDKTLDILERDYNWWKILKDDKDTYIDIRNSGQINVYINGGSLLTIQTNEIFEKIKFKTNIKYIPFPKCEDSYVTLSSDKENLSINDDKLSKYCTNLSQYYEKLQLLINDESFQEMKNLVKAYSLPEKIIQGRYALNNGEEQGLFIDTEFQYSENDKSPRIDLVYLQLKNKKGFLDTPNLYFVELKRECDERLFKKPSKEDGKRIDEQIKDYFDFLQNNNNVEELKKYYLKLIGIKSKHRLIKTQEKELLKRINKISDINIARKPILLIGDCGKDYKREKEFEDKKVSDYKKDVREMTTCRVYRGIGSNYINLGKSGTHYIRF